MKRHIANILTGFRILGSILMLFFQVFSIPFYILYLFCGLSDLIDGIIARKTNSITDFSSKFDSSADLIFAAAALIKILPALSIPNWLWLWILMIAAIKVFNMAWGIAFEKRIVVEHTIMNKITGLLLFILPLTLPFIEFEYSAIAVCAVATFAAVQEGHYIRTGKEIT
ncbi:CDP-alcohol phosphatidyltransferase family protein [Methanobrevibacter sp.]|uniref:CDP-alcohol phosphatidyltransferase family protein n=1 Tax=Methanobrevibacter sp. TaxID=66852 RepID=UPI00388D015E